MNKLISFTALVSFCFLLTNCQKKEETPAPSISSTTTFKEETLTSSSNTFTLNGDGNSNTQHVVDTAYQQDFSSYGSRLPIDSFQLAVYGKVAIGGQTKNTSVWLNTHYSGLGNYPIGSTVNDQTRLSISFYSSTDYIDKYYTCQSGSLIITSIDNGYFTATYSGVFMVNDDPTNTVTISDGVFVCPYQTYNF